jgi:hypothetical protein
MIGDWWMFITIHPRKNHGILGSMDEICREWPSPWPTLSSQGCSVRSLRPYALRGWDAAPMMPNKKDVRLEVMAWWRCPVVRFEMAFQLRKLQEYPKISKLPDSSRPKCLQGPQFFKGPTDGQLKICDTMLLRLWASSSGTGTGLAEDLIRWIDSTDRGFVVWVLGYC